MTTMAFEALAAAGGPKAFIARAEKEAGDGEARVWLRTLTAFAEEFAAADLEPPGQVEAYLRHLRCRLRAPPDLERVRAKTRERVRRFRARRSAG